MKIRLGDVEGLKFERLPGATEELYLTVNYNSIISKYNMLMTEYANTVIEIELPEEIQEEDVLLNKISSEKCNGYNECLSKVEKSKVRVVNDEQMYTCTDCGKLRTKDEGGTTFTVCDECWDKHYKKGK